MNPITIKTLTYDLQHGIFLESHIQNATSGPLYIESVKLDPAPIFVAHDLNSNEETKTLTSLVLDMVYLKPNDVRQYLFRLEPKTPQAKGATILGRLDIGWRSNMGEKGTLQSAPIERKLPNQVDVEIQLKNIPSNIILEQPFKIDCDVTNRSDNAISLQITFVKSKMQGIMWNGISGQLLGRLPPGSTTSVPLTFFAIKPGVQKINGIRLVDTNLERNYDFDDVIDIFVET
eukprot:TRINITY_DN5868_c0_g1_i2.p1 TRINITY_DN5868_c0_g1~~TRINITY_DN5868_c0_g1_i2.p1  ORF type:complete len:232 (-),score=55.95 TRINITY_DN5868_c0_g1_i2:48-743(-)